MAINAPLVGVSSSQSPGAVLVGKHDDLAREFEQVGERHEDGHR